MRLRQQTGWTRMEFREEEEKTRDRGGSALGCRAGRRPPCLPLIRALLDPPPAPPDRSLPFFFAPHQPNPTRSLPPYLLFLLVCMGACVSYPHVLVSEDLVEKLSQRPPHLVVTLFACLKLRHTLCYGSSPPPAGPCLGLALSLNLAPSHTPSNFSAAMDSIPILSSIYGFAFRQGKMASGISPSSGGRKGERTEG